MQVGKNGLTEGFMQALKHVFETHDTVKISVFRSATHEKEEVKAMAERIVAQLGRKYTYRLVGFTISLRKWRNVPLSNRKKDILSDKIN